MTAPPAPDLPRPVDAREGRYQGIGEPFTLQRVEGGYRRVFEPGRWLWSDDKVWTVEEVETHVRRGTWRKKA